jgi:plastocyanin
MTSNKARVAATLLLGLGALAACGAPKGPQAKSYTVEMQSLAYSPTVVSARVGDTIVWSNKDILRHTATARDGAFDVDLDTGQTGTTKLAKPGTIAVYCRYHPGMTAQILVSP